MVRSLITQTQNFIPTYDISKVEVVRGNIDLYCNANVDAVLHKLEYSDNTVYSVNDSSLTAWYPLD
jgi:hypothetical protein